MQVCILCARIPVSTHCLSAQDNKIPFPPPHSLREFEADADGAGRECCICLDDHDELLPTENDLAEGPAATSAVTASSAPGAGSGTASEKIADGYSVCPCGHIFGTSCLEEALRTALQCPFCRNPTRLQDVFSVQKRREKEQKSLEEVKQRMEQRAADGEKALAASNTARGTKIDAICEQLRDIKRQDPTAKAIVFCQFPTLQTKIAGEFRRRGFPYRTLEGSVETRNRELAAFQQLEGSSSSSPEVLLLNLETQASGAHCTRASHVLFVHPVLTLDLATALAHEEQAIGRVKRIGQQKKQIHVYRFCAEATVEAELWDERKSAQKAAARRGAGVPAVPSSSAAGATTLSTSSSRLAGAAAGGASSSSSSGAVVGGASSSMQSGGGSSSSGGAGSGTNGGGFYNGAGQNFRELTAQEVARLTPDQQFEYVLKLSKMQEEVASSRAQDEAGEAGCSSNAGRNLIGKGRGSSSGGGFGR